MPLTRSPRAAAVLLICMACTAIAEPIEISGRYPHLAMWNKQNECGVGAVVPWAGRLWVITYAPHQPKGSDDKLYEIDDALNVTIRPESIGGTPANRMIHRESGQLFIGPYVIDRERNVRVIPYTAALGRPTANARHLTDPANRIYLYTMEEGLYDIDVETLDVKTIMQDGHAKGWVDPLPGYHGKGAYSAQGRLVVANNGEKKLNWKQHPYGPSGVLAESTDLTPGKARWNVVERAQFTDVTGPGGIEGNAAPDDPLWAIGWDRRSAMLKVLDDGKWRTYRLPVADFSYIASHGWYTEWPRIRNVADNAVLVNIHGTWFATPRISKLPDLVHLGSYLKITGDFCEWNGRIVFGCDDTAITGGNTIAGQSHSNLWFTSWEGLHRCGAPVGWGGPWVHDDVEADVPSDPYLYVSYKADRILHLSHDSDVPVRFIVEAGGSPRFIGQWTTIAAIEVPAHGYAWKILPDDAQGPWLRIRTDRDAKRVTAYLHYGVSRGAVTDRALFASLADADVDAPRSDGIIRPRGRDLRTLQLLTHDGVYYEIGDDLKLRQIANADTQIDSMKRNAAIDEKQIAIDDASVIVIDRRGRWRLPVASASYRTDKSLAPGAIRAIREVVTERTLLNAGGLMYVNPDDDSLGFRGLKPICTHNKRIGDFCSWRGLLVMIGVKAGAPSDDHTIVSDDGKAALWVGDIDDLWKLGKPRGVGGPWRNSSVAAGKPSDPYLMTGYDRKTLTLSHDAAKPVTFTVEVDIDNSGTFHTYAELPVKPGERATHVFPAGYSAHWVRFVADADCLATAQLRYE